MQEARPALVEPEQPVVRVCPELLLEPAAPVLHGGPDRAFPIAGIEPERRAVEHDRHGRIGLPLAADAYERRLRQDRESKCAALESRRTSEDAGLDALSG